MFCYRKIQFLFNQISIESYFKIVDSFNIFDGKNLKNVL